MAKVEAKALGMNPFTRICYICGRQFGSKSISIHEKNCIDKWKAHQAKLPKSERLPLPRRPEGWDQEGSHPQDMNDAAFTSYLDQARKTCPNCGRGFAGDRLQVHLRSCTPNGYFAKQAKSRQEKSLSISSLPDTSAAVSIKKLEDTSIRSPQVNNKNSHKRPVTLPEKAQRPLPELPQQPVSRGTYAKFCHLCGVGFPTHDAKFCGSCGEKRVLLLS